MKALLWMLLLSLPVGIAVAGSKNGFDLEDGLIPEHEILKGGPPRDGIPAIDHPKYESVSAAAWLKDHDRVLGIVVDGYARAYPVRILNYHEIVNDQIGERHFAVTYCPLCGTGIVFSSDLGGTPLEFGVSGLLYNSDVLLFDRNTDSLFSQIMGKGVTGQYKGVELSRLPVSHTSWADWRVRHPQTDVLSRDTGHRRDYRRSPYNDYDQIRKLYFRVSNRAPDDYHPKEQVLGVEINGVYKAYPFSELQLSGQSRFSDRLANSEIEVTWNEKARTASAFNFSGEELATVTAFWFAWYAFHPDTQVFKANTERPE